MRSRSPTVLAVLALAAVLLGTVAPPAQAGCSAPVLVVGTTADDAHPPATGGSLVAGQDLSVSGLRFHSGCDDTGESSGCSAPPAPTEAPLRDVDLVLEQGGRTWTLDTQDASGRESGYALRWDGRVPADAAPGPATLRAATTRLPVEITG